jgi:hypothetical protein
LSLPFRLRLLLARDGRLLGKVRTIFMRTVRTWQRLQARRLGLRGATTAAVCFTQLFGSRLDCSPHFHALAPDAVFLENQQGDIELRRLPKPKLEEIERLVERIARRTLAMLKKELGEDLRLDALDRLRASNLQQLSFSAMAEPPEDRVGKLSARCEGFSLQAGRHLHENEREGLEALVRYCLRPPVAQGRLSMAENDSGKVVLKLKRPLADGSTTLEMTPITLLKRLAGLVPRPRSHAIHYYGGFASHANLRSRIVPRSPRVRRRCRAAHKPQGQLELQFHELVPIFGDRVDLLQLVKAPAPRARELDWPSLLRRTFASEIFDCDCGGRRRVVAFVSDRAQAMEILQKLGLPTQAPRIARARGPPCQEELFDRPSGDFAADPIYPDG